MPDLATLERQLENAPTPPERIAVLLELTDQLRKSDLARALRLGGEAADLAHRLGLPDEEARALLKMGHCHKESGDFTLALSTLEQAEKLTQNTALLADLAAEIGGTLERMGDHPGALERLRQALSHTDPLTQPRDYGDTLNSIAIVYMEMHDHEEGMRYFAETLEHYQAAGSRLRYANTSANLGVAHKKHGDPLEAEQRFRDALEVFREEGYENGVATTLMNLGSLLVQENRPREAEEALSTALEMTRRLGLKMVEAYVHQKFGKLYLDTNRLEEAEARFSEALLLFAFVGHRKGEAEVREDLARLYRTCGDFERACAELELLHALEKQLFDEASNKRLRQLQVRFEVDKERQEAEIRRLRTVELENLLREKSALVQQLETLSITDGLTGLYNRRHLDGAARRSFEEAVQAAGALSISLADIDFFKRVNDTFGHAIGDEVLRKVAQLYRENVREGDLIARYGGEEFALVMPGTKLEAALEVCERVRRAVEVFEWSTIHPNLRVTLSLGVCDALTLGSHEKMLQDADRWLYQAKHQGKNQVCSRGCDPGMAPDGSVARAGE